MTRRVVVIGAGVAGLVSAWEAARSGAQVTVLESHDDIGGPVGAHRLGGLVLDSGTESFAVRGGAVAELLEELGLGDRIVAPNPAGAWVGFADADRFRAAPLPRTGLLGIPGDLDDPALRDVLGEDGLAAAQRDLQIDARETEQLTSLGELVEARLGRAVLDRLVSPVAGGVYSSDPAVLQVDAVAPGLRDALLSTGSLSGAVAQLRARATPGSAVRGVQGGMNVLVGRLREEILAQGGRILTGTAVSALEREEGGVRVVASDAGIALHADLVVIATPADSALALLAGLASAGDATGAEPVASAFDGVDWPAPAEVTLVTLVIDDERLDADPRGTGILIAPSAPDVQAKALTHVTAKWRWARDAAQNEQPGRHVVRLSYGHAGDHSEADSAHDTHQLAQAVADARTIFGVDFADAAIVGHAIHQWRHAQPGASRDALDAAIESLAPTPITVVGSWRSGTGLASVVPHTRTAIARALHDIAASGVSDAALERTEEPAQERKTES